MKRTMTTTILIDKYPPDSKQLLPVSAAPFVVVGICRCCVYLSCMLSDFFACLHQLSNTPKCRPLGRCHCTHTYTIKFAKEAALPSWAHSLCSVNAYTGFQYHRVRFVIFAWIFLIATIFSTDPYNIWKARKVLFFHWLYMYSFSIQAGG